MATMALPALQAAASGVVPMALTGSGAAREGAWTGESGGSARVYVAQGFLWASGGRGVRSGGAGGWSGGGIGGWGGGG